MRKIPAECKDAFGVAVSALRKLGKTDVAIDAVMKVDRVHLQKPNLCIHSMLTRWFQSGDIRLLCELYMECGKWAEAFKTAEAQPELLKMVRHVLRSLSFCNTSAGALAACGAPRSARQIRRRDAGNCRP